VKILFVNHYGSLVGGAEGYIADVAIALQEAGHVCHLAYMTLGEGHGLMEDTTPIPSSNWPTLSLDMVKAFESLLHGFSPDVLYLHGVQNPRLVQWLCERVPTVAYVHNAVPVCPGMGQYLRRSEHECSRKAGAMCLLNAYREDCIWGRNPISHMLRLLQVRSFVSAYNALPQIIVGSSYMQTLLLRGGISADKISILAPVLMTEHLPSFTPTTDSQTVLFVGRLVPEKGLHYLLRALARLERDWELLIVGDGEQRRWYGDLALQLGISDQVHFLGWLEKQAVMDFIRRSSLVAVPSLIPESFCRAGVEALASGRPVVAFSTGGIKDWLVDGEFGFLVPPRDIVGLARAISTLLDSPNLRLEIGFRARKKITSDMSAHKHVKCLESIFDRARAQFQERYLSYSRSW